MKNLFLALSIFLSIQVYSQINFESGYIIKNDNTKTDCLIKNVGWQNNPTKIEYKLNESGSSQFATIAEIKEFNVGEKYKYVRFNTQIERSSTNIALMNGDRNPVFNNETLFLKVLVEGEINLYEYVDNNLTRFFISSGNHAKAEQLVYKEYLSDNAVAENNYFRQQLTVALKSDVLSTKDFKYLEYKKKELVAIIEKYDNSKGAKSTNFEIKQNQESFNLKALTGVNFTSLSISNQELISYKNVDFDSKAVFIIGLEAEFILPFNQNKWSLFVDPNFQSYTGKGTTTDGKLVEADYKFIELPFGARYSFFMQNNAQIFMNAGFTLPFNFNSTISYHTTYYNPVLDIKSSANFFVGVGFRKNNFGFEIRYNANRELLGEYVSWDSKYSSIGLLGTYKFL